MDSVEILDLVVATCIVEIFIPQVYRLEKGNLSTMYRQKNVNYFAFRGFHLGGLRVFLAWFAYY